MPTFRNIGADPTDIGAFTHADPGVACPPGATLTIPGDLTEPAPPGYWLIRDRDTSHTLPRGRWDLVNDMEEGDDDAAL